MTYYVNDHVVQRAIERLPDCQGRDADYVRTWLGREISKSFRIGRQNKESTYLKISGGVAVIDKGNRLATVLSDDMYRSNTEIHYDRMSHPAPIKLRKGLADAFAMIEREKRLA